MFPVHQTKWKEKHFHATFTDDAINAKLIQNQMMLSTTNDVAAKACFLSCITFEFLEKEDNLPKSTAKETIKLSNSK